MHIFMDREINHMRVSKFRIKTCTTPIQNIQDHEQNILEKTLISSSKCSENLHDTCIYRYKMSLKHILAKFPFFFKFENLKKKLLHFK